MDWLDRARRELPECARGGTANTAVRGLSAVTAVRPEGESIGSGASIGSIGSAEHWGPPDEEGLRDEFEERAGILEFDAGLSRSEAERLAWELVVARHTVH